MNAENKKHNRKKMINQTVWLILIFIFVFSPVSYGSEKCEQGRDATGYERIQTFCHPDPQDYGGNSSSRHAGDWTLIPSDHWKITQEYEPLYCSFWDTSVANDYSFNKRDIKGSTLFTAGANWSRKCLKKFPKVPKNKEELSCHEFIWQHLCREYDSMDFYEDTSKAMVYNVYDWAGCWPKMVIDRDGYWVDAVKASGDSNLLQWNEFLHCGLDEYGFTKYAGKFDDPQNSAYIAFKGCCDGIVFDRSKQCCTHDEKKVPRVLDLQSGLCPNPNCWDEVREHACDAWRCLEVCQPQTIISVQLFKEIGPIRKMPCPLLCLQGAGHPFPQFPPGCDGSRLFWPVVGCCSYHEGLSMKIEFVDCDGRRLTKTLSLHFASSFGEGNDFPVGPLPTTCPLEVISGLPMSIQTEEASMSLAVPAMTSMNLGVPSSSSTSLEAPAPVSTSSAPAADIAGDECVIEKINNGQSVMICRCPDLTPSGFCIKKLNPNGTSAPANLFVESAAPSKTVKDGMLGVSLPVTRICEVPIGPFSADDLSSMLGAICTPGGFGDYNTHNNNCGNVQDQILNAYFKIADPRNVCERPATDYFCGPCLVGAGDFKGLEAAACQIQ